MSKKVKERSEKEKIKVTKS
jgi:hypothetical protein